MSDSKRSEFLLGVIEAALENELGRERAREILNRCEEITEESSHLWEHPWPN